MKKRRNTPRTDTKENREKDRSDTGAERTCFVIMPFGGWFDLYYENVFQPAVIDAGLTPQRADDLYRPGTIVNDIWTLTKTSEIVLADLTNRNSNVFYELGLAHALAKPVVLVTESIDHVPFDLRALRVLEYDKNRPDWGSELQVSITQSIKEVSGSPLESVLPAFLSVKPSERGEVVTEHDKAILELRQEVESLRVEMRHYRVPYEREQPLDPLLAEAMLRRYIKDGMPKELILRRLERRGVPLHWIRKRMEQLDPQLPLFSFEDGPRDIERVAPANR